MASWVHGYLLVWVYDMTEVKSDDSVTDWRFELFDFDKN